MKDWQYFLDAGGFVMLPLAVFTVLLWYALGYRYAAMRRSGSRRNVRRRIGQYRQQKWNKPRGVIDEAIIQAFVLQQAQPVQLRPRLDQAFWPYQKMIGQYSVLIKTIVYSAPLLGLLGTVSGMIETFDSLQSMTLFSQSGGIAGGISQALITTQFGLAVAIPGLLMNGFLDKKQRRIEMELAQLKDIVCSEADQEQIKRGRYAVS